MPGDLEISAADKELFKRCLETYENASPEMPFFIESKDGEAISIKKADALIYNSIASAGRCCLRPGQRRCLLCPRAALNIFPFVHIGRDSRTVRIIVP